MIDASREAAILERITKIPIFETLRMGPAVDLFDAAGTLVAVAQVNYMLLDRMPRR